MWHCSYIPYIYYPNSIYYDNIVGLIPVGSASGRGWTIVWSYKGGVTPIGTVSWAVTVVKIFDCPKMALTAWPQWIFALDPLTID